MTLSKVIGGALLLGALVLFGHALGQPSLPPGEPGLSPRAGELIGAAFLAVIGVAFLTLKYTGTGVEPAPGAAKSATPPLPFWAGLGRRFAVFGLLCVVGPFFGVVPRALTHSSVPVPLGVVQLAGLGFLVLGGILWAVYAPEKSDAPAPRQKHNSGVV